MKRNVLFYFLGLATLFNLTSCGDEPGDQKEDPKGKYETGYFVTNEGPFRDGTGTVSYVDADGNVTQEVYQAENDGEVLGNILQSMTIIDTTAYFMINNAEKIEVASGKTLKSIGRIDSLKQPRYMIPVGNDKAYVSQWVDGFHSMLAVIDLTNNSILEQIDLQQSGAENMVMVNGKVYVANSGGFGNDSTVSIVNVAARTVLNYAIGDNPVDVAVDKNKAVWVLTKGYTDWVNSENNRPGGLYKLENDEVTASFELPLNSSPGHLEINKAGDKLYFLRDGKIFSHSISATSLDTIPFAELAEFGFYGLGVNPKNDHVLGTSALDYKTLGDVHEYDANGNELSNFKAGLIPGGFYFND